MTKVVNLFGGSGCGKSTTAALVFGELKLAGVNVELCREYVKAWAWEGRKIQPFDQVYLAGKQSRAESILYGKVDVVVTDSPILLSPVYERFYGKTDSVLPAVMEHMKKAEAAGVQYVNIVLNRNKPFDTRGRYETEELARQVDTAVKAMLTELKMPYYETKGDDRSRIGEIIKVISE